MQTPCGSPYYAAPEILQGKPYDGPKADIWSAGIVLYTLAIGKVPWTATTHKHLYDQICRAQYALPPYLDVDITTMITSCLTPNPASRPAAYELLFFPLLRPLAGELLLPIQRNRQKSLPPTLPVMMGKSAMHSILYKQSNARSHAYIQRFRLDPINDGTVRTLPVLAV
jgi:serine/threonine protein kinase